MRSGLGWEGLEKYSNIRNINILQMSRMLAFVLVGVFGDNAPSILLSYNSCNSAFVGKLSA